MDATPSARPRRIDMHVHMVGNGRNGSGGWLRLSGWHRWLAGFMLRQLGVPASALEGDLESIYAEHLVELVRASSMDAIVLLAHERVHDPDGTPRDDLGSMFVPNDVVLGLARKFPEFLAGVSIHPARHDALDELDRCLAGGAVLMKCLPNCQNIDPSDRRYGQFWERMAAAGLPLLAHTGGEHTVPIVDAAFADPKLLRFPLECGVTVIAAHCATGSGMFDRDYFDDWVAMLREFPILAVTGSSGSGKTTLLKVVAGMEKPDGGTVELGHGARPQMVFQDAGASLTPWLTVGELVGERLRAEGVGRAERASRVTDALALVGLSSEVAGAKAAQLSGGQRQRVALARATIVPPEVLLCDEPTSALDVSLAATVLNLIGRIRRELGMAMLFVTHDLGAARVVADRIAVMYLGRIVEIGPASEVVASPRHPYTEALLGAVPAIGVVRSPLQGEPASPMNPPSGCPFHPRCSVALDSCSSTDVPLLTIGKRSVACVRAGERVDTMAVAVAGR